MKFRYVAFPALVLIIGGGLVVPQFMDWNKYKPLLQDQVAKTSGLELNIGGDLSFSLFPMPHMMVSDVSVLQSDQDIKSDFLTLENLEVSVALMPLLSGNVDVSSITLVDPKLILALKDGKVVLPKFGPSDAQKVQEEDKDSSELQKSPSQITLNDIRLENGEVIVKSEEGNPLYTISEITSVLDVDLNKSIYGASGSFVYAGNHYDTEFQMAQNNESEYKISTKLVPDIKGTEINFNGLLNLKDNISFDGKINGATENLKSLLSLLQVNADLEDEVTFNIESGLEYSSKELKFADFNADIASSQITGNISYLFENGNVTLNLKNSGKFDLNKIVKNLQNIPSDLDFDIHATGEMNKSVSLEKSKFKINGQALNVSGIYKFAQNKKLRPSLTINANAENISLENVAVLQGNSNEKAVESQSGLGNAAGSKESVSSALPFDISSTINAKSIKFKDVSLDNLSFEGGLQNNTLTFKKFEVGQIAGAKIKASGSVGDIKNLRNIALSLETSSKDIKATLATLKQDSSFVPDYIKSIDIRSNIKGSIDKLDVSANVNAINGEFILQGVLNNALNALQIDNFAVQVKHKNMAQLIQTVSGSNDLNKNYAKPVDIYAKIKQNGKKYNLSEINGMLAGIALKGNLDVDMSSKVPELNGKLDFGAIQLDSEFTNNNSSSQGSGGSSGAAVANKSQRWSKNPIDTKVLSMVNADFQVSAARFKYGEWDLNQPKGHINLKDGVLYAKDIQAGMFDGSIALNVQAKSSPQDRQPIHIEGQSHISNISIAPLVNALGGSKLVSVSGRLGGDVSIKSSGTSAAALIYDLSGNGAVNGNGIVLNGVDVVRFVRALSDESKPGDTVLGLWKGSTKGGTTNFDTLDGAFSIQEGNVTLSKMDLDGPRAAIETRGNINLPDWTLNTKHKMIVKGTADTPSDVPPFEISFNGSLDNPTQTFGQGLLNDYLNRKIQRKLNSIISKKLGVAQDDNAQQPGDAAGNNEAQPSAGDDVKKIIEKPEDVVKDVLKGLLQ